MDLHFDFVNHIVAALLLEPHYLIHLFLDALLNRLFFLPAILEVVIIVLVFLTIPPQELHHESLCPEWSTSLSSNLTLRSICPHVLISKHSAKFSGSGCTRIVKHREGHLEDIIDHTDIAEHIVQILNHSV